VCETLVIPNFRSIHRSINSLELHARRDLFPTIQSRKQRRRDELFVQIFLFVTLYRRQKNDGSQKRSPTRRVDERKRRTRKIVGRIYYLWWMKAKYDGTN